MKDEELKTCPFCKDNVEISEKQDSCLSCWGKGHYTILYYFIALFTRIDKNEKK